MRKEYKIKYAVRLGVRLLASAAAGVILAAGMLRYAGSTIASVAVGLAAFAIVALVLRVPELLKPGWDGVVTSKTVRYITTRSGINVPEYELIVTDPRGREHRDVFLDKEDKGMQNRIDYYDHGERVRRHRGYKYYEKFDKTGKNDVVCINCGKLNSLQRERCLNCGLPLLRENI